MKKTLIVLIALLIVLCGSVSAETLLYDSEAIVLYDFSALPDWTSRYGLETPGTLLELTQPEGLFSIAAISRSATPEKSLSERLDLAGETLSVSDAQISQWNDPFDGDGRCLSYTYTYPDGDERHISRIYSASFGNMLLELTMDCWGDMADEAVSSLTGVFIEGGFSVRFLSNPVEVVGELSDVSESSDGAVQIELTLPGGEGRRSYPLSPEAVLLFPSLDDPYQYDSIRADMASLTDAILTYEESSDSPAVFRAVLCENEIIYMEHTLS